MNMINKIITLFVMKHVATKIIKRAHSVVWNVFASNKNLLQILQYIRFTKYSFYLLWLLYISVHVPWDISPFTWFRGTKLPYYSHPKPIQTIHKNSKRPYNQYVSSIYIIATAWPPPYSCQYVQVECHTGILYKCQCCTKRADQDCSTLFNPSA